MLHRPTARPPTRTAPQSPRIALALAAYAMACTASAQPQPATTTRTMQANAQIETLDRTQAEQARAKARADAAPPVYVDRFMDAAEAPSPGDDDAAPEAATPLRSWMSESRIGFGEANASGADRRRAMELGQRLEYRQQTLNYGELTVQADGRHLGGGDSAGNIGIGALGYARQATSGRATLRSLGLPLTAHVFADSAIGDVYSEVTEGLARNYRLSLGTTVVRGASVRVFAADTELRAGFGRRGALAGGPYPGFEQGQGTLGWLGATQRLGGPWFAAVQLARAAGIPSYDLDPFTGRGLGLHNVDSWAASLGDGREVLADGDLKARATLLGSRAGSRGDAGPGPAAGSTAAHGLFVEASARTGRLRHEFGGYDTQPALYFGDYPVAGGSRGAYWRFDQSLGHLNWGLGIDHERTRPDARFDLPASVRTGTSGNLQYLFDRYTTLGGSLSLYQARQGRHAGPGEGSNPRSLYGNAYVQTYLFDWPRSRWSLTLRRNEQIVLGSGAATGQELQWEQDLIGGRFDRRDTRRPELTATLGMAHDQSGRQSRRYPTAGLQFGWWFDNGAHLGGNLRYTSQSGGLYTSRGLSGSLTADMPLPQGWRVGFSASLNQARASVLPTAFDGPRFYRSNDRSAYVFLRWDGSTGSGYAPAGLRGADAGPGSGSVVGRVFFDANRDGDIQPGEGGVANVEVLLDGRYRAVTDRDGRFEFPLVATGRHQLALTPETVPLPWGPAAASGASVDVPLRGQASLAMPVIKVRD